MPGRTLLAIRERTICISIVAVLDSSRINIDLTSRIVIVFQVKEFEVNKYDNYYQTTIGEEGGQIRCTVSGKRPAER